MSRIEGRKPEGLWGLVLRAVYFMTRRKLGKVVMPVQVASPGLQVQSTHRPPLQD